MAYNYESTQRQKVRPKRNGGKRKKSLGLVWKKGFNRSKSLRGLNVIPEMNVGYRNSFILFWLYLRFSSFFLKKIS